MNVEGVDGMSCDRHYINVSSHPLIMTKNRPTATDVANSLPPTHPREPIYPTHGNSNLMKF